MMVSHAGDRESLMLIARRHGVPGVIGDCGGVMACATCHVHVMPEWQDRVGPPSVDERELIEMTADPRPESRLGCQVFVTSALDGLRVKVAPA